MTGYKVSITAFFVIALTMRVLFCQETDLERIIAKGAVVEKLAGGFSFTEGPSPDRTGNVFFTDQPNNRILKWSTGGELSTFLEPSGRSNGLFFARNGDLYACADEKNELWCIKPDKTIEIITGEYNNALFNGPNDLWIDPDGKIYFTDPFYRRNWWSHTNRPQDKQCVYLLLPGNKSVIRVAEDLVQPNGIIGTPDGEKIYVADIGGKKTWSYRINDDGTLSDKTLFCEMGSDGMTIDRKGNVYLTGNGVTVFDKNGTLLGNIPVPEKWTANVCFGNKNRKTLFITASTGLYCMKMKVRGAY